MADNNIIIKITSEADLSSAQKQLADLTKQAEQLEIEMANMQTEYEKEAAAIKKLKLPREQEVAELQKLKQSFRDIKSQRKEEMATTKQSIKELEKSVKAYKTLTGAAGKAVQQLRAMRERLMEMEDAGEFGTQAFIDLSIAAAKLEDQIGDTQQRIRILASDTKNMDAVMGLGDGLAGTFYIATSAAELFGDEMEGLQKAFYKVQAAMSIVSGAQQVYNALQKDSAAMVVLNTAVTKLFTKAKTKSAAVTTADAAASGADAAAKTGEAAATEAAAKAQWSLNAAFAANPLGFVIAGVAALAAGIYALYKIFDKTERRLRNARKEYEKQSAYTEYYLIKYAQDHDKTMRDIDKRENESLNKMKKRHASSLEMNKEELKYLKERQAEVEKYAEKAITKNNEEIRAARELVDARAEDYKKSKAGSKAREEALKALTEAEEQWNNAVAAGRAIEDERTEARNAVVEKELEIEEELRSIRQRTEQAKIDIMREGQAKEKAQIEENYKEQLREIKGHGAEETALREAIIKKRDQEIADLERKYAIQQAKTLTEIDVAMAEEATKALRGNEGVAAQLAVWDNYYDAHKAQIEENAKFEKEEIERSSDSEEVKAARMLQIDTQMQADLTALSKEGAEKRIEIETEYINDLQREVERTQDIIDKAEGGASLSALKDNLDAQLNLYEAQQDKIDAQLAAGVISFEDYKQQEWEITKAIADAEYNYQKSKQQLLINNFNTALNTIQQVSDLAFEALGNHVQAELDALEEEYTTDAEEAKKNANKKLITQEEYDRKKAALELKQAKYNKAQALISAAINTALAITAALSQAPPASYVMAAINAAMGAAQIAVIASKPLAQYEKGRKGGKGEYALVGEKGAELMYVPEGASIVPNNKLGNPAAWADYGVPRLEIPELPSISGEAANYVATSSNGGLVIDYDKLGEAVARNIPKQQRVVVNVDRAGVHVAEGHELHTYLNRKYVGSWH